jgi:putative transposase
VIQLSVGTKVWIAAGVTDLRRGFDGLSAQVQNVLHELISSLKPFCFCSKGRIWFSKVWSKSKHTEVQMIAALKQVEAGRKVEDVAREFGVSKHTIYAWKAKYGGMDVSEAQEARQLRDENTRLRKLVADLSLDKEALQSVIRKNGWSS